MVGRALVGSHSTHLIHQGMLQGSRIIRKSITGDTRLRKILIRKVERFCTWICLRVRHSWVKLSFARFRLCKVNCRIERAWNGIVKLNEKLIFVVLWPPDQWMIIENICWSRFIPLNWPKSLVFSYYWSPKRRHHQINLLLKWRHHQNWKSPKWRHHHNGSL